MKICSKSIPPQRTLPKRNLTPEEVKIEEAYSIVTDDIIRNIKSYACPQEKDHSKYKAMADRLIDDRGDIQLDLEGHMARAESSNPLFMKMLCDILTSENKAKQIQGKIEYCVEFYNFCLFRCSLPILHIPTGYLQKILYHPREIDQHEVWRESGSHPLPGWDVHCDRLDGDSFLLSKHVIICG